MKKNKQTKDKIVSVKKKKESKRSIKMTVHDHAKIATLPAFSAATLVTCLKKDSNLEGARIMVHMVKREQAVSKGDISHVEAMLLHQAEALEALFYHYMDKMRRAEYISQAEAYANIAFKAQKQSRVALSALLDAKRPKRTAFIKHQNNAINQQINGSLEMTEKSQENKIILENELLETPP